MNNSENKVLKRSIKKLLICGGGFKFFYLIGSIKYLFDLNIINDIEEYISVSAGAMLSVLFGVGYKPNELNNFFLQFNFEKLINPSVESLLEHRGLDEGEIKKVALQHLLKKKNINPEINFKEFYEQFNKKLTFIGSNITKNKLEIINYETYPDLPIWKGMLITSALPILFEPIILDDQYIIDGGVFDNYPIDLFFDETILGINLVTHIEHTDFNTDVFNYLSKLFVLAYNWKNLQITNKYINYTIQIKTFDSSELINGDVSLDERIRRIDHGYLSAKEHFEKFEFKQEEKIEQIKLNDEISADSEESEQNDNIEEENTENKKDDEKEVSDDNENATEEVSN